jgi:hypothetical protein
MNNVHNLCSIRGSNDDGAKQTTQCEKKRKKSESEVADLDLEVIKRPRRAESPCVSLPPVDKNQLGAGASKQVTDSVAESEPASLASKKVPDSIAVPEVRTPTVARGSIVNFFKKLPGIKESKGSAAEPAKNMEKVDKVAEQPIVVIEIVDDIVSSETAETFTASKDGREHATPTVSKVRVAGKGPSRGIKSQSVRSKMPATEKRMDKNKDDGSISGNQSVEGEAEGKQDNLVLEVEEEEEEERTPTISKSLFRKNRNRPSRKTAVEPGSDSDTSVNMESLENSPMKVGPLGDVQECRSPVMRGESVDTGSIATPVVETPAAGRPNAFTLLMKKKLPTPEAKGQKISRQVNFFLFLTMSGDFQDQTLIFNYCRS